MLPLPGMLNPGVEMVVLEAREVEVRGRAIFILRGDDRRKIWTRRLSQELDFLMDIEE